MKTTDVVTQTRSLDPTSPQEFEGFASSPEGRRLFQRIVAAPLSTAATPRRRRAVAALVATALLAGAGAVAAAVALTQPDAKQARQVENEHSDEATVHLRGWRPELQAEAVRCTFPGSMQGSQAIETIASEFPLKQRLAYKGLSRECAQGNDLARINGPFATSDTVVCVDRSGSYPKAVVAVGATMCPIGTRPMTDPDLDELNRMRGIEVAVLAVPSDDGCPTSDQASDWARGRLTEYGVNGFSISASNEGAGCYRGTVYWQAGKVLVGRTGNQKP